MKQFTLAFTITAALFTSLVHADIILNPQDNGATEFTDFSGTVINPLGNLTGLNLVAGYNAGNSGELIINNQNLGNGLKIISDSSGLLGYQEGSTGTATITGSGAAWNNTVAFYAGNLGNGTLRVEDSGAVNSSHGFIGTGSNSVGTATITGTNSQWNNAGNPFYVGHSGDGTLNIEDGGTVNHNNNIGYIGFNTDSIGAMNVIGTDAGLNPSKWVSNHHLYVGNSGNGTLKIEAGGLVSNATGYIGFGANSISSATVSGKDASLNPSTWTNNGDLHVGYSGNGTLKIEAGGKVSNTNGWLGYTSTNSSGTATVTGADSTWTNSGTLRVGNSGDGTLSILDGGKVTSVGTSYTAVTANKRGDVTINGANSSWSNNGTLYLGYVGNTTLKVEAGGALSNTHGYLGFNSGSSGNATVTGADSTWTSTGEFRVGHLGNGTLNIEDGGSVSSDSASNDSYIAFQAGQTGDVTIKDANSSWTTNDKALYVGYSGTATLNVEAGGSLSDGIAYLGWNNGSTANATVTGTDASLNPSTWTNSSQLRVGQSGNATLLIEAGGNVSSNAISYIATASSSTSTVTVTGANSSWTTNDNILYVGNSGDATLNIEAGGNVSNSIGHIGYHSGSLSTTTVTGANSSWDNSSNLFLGFNSGSNGTLNIEHGGTVSNTVGFIGNFAGSIGTANVTGANALWDNTDSVYVGGSATAAGGNGTLNLNTDGTVSATNSVHLWNTGNINLFGGTLKTADITFTNNTLNFVAGTLHFTQTTFFNPTDATNHDINTLSTGKTLRVVGMTLLGTPITLSGGTLSTDSISGFGLIDFQSGTFELTNDNLTVGSTGIAGATINLQAGKHIILTNNATIDTNGLLNIAGGSFAAATTTNNGRVELDGSASLLEGGTVVNNAFIEGNGRISAMLNNTTNGQVNAVNGEKISFFGSGNTNDGTIGVINATVEFTQDLTNNASGSITARDAILRFGGGVINDGSIGLSFGNSDIYGDITNNSDGAVVVTGASSATFQGNVVNNGDIRVSTGSTAVFFGDVSGGGSFSGSGTIFFEQAFSPGNSPGEVDFGGDLVLSSATDLLMELAGTTAGVNYDHLDINGALWADGTLDIQLLDGFAPTLGDRFNLFDFNEVNGSFSNIYLPTLGSGLSFDTTSLLTTGFISVVPEPTTAMLLSLSGLLWIRRCRMS